MFGKVDGEVGWIWKTSRRMVRGMVVAAVIGASVASSAVLGAVPPLGGSVPVAGTTLAARPVLRGYLYRDVFTPFEIKDAWGNVVVKGRLEDVVIRSAITGRMHFYSRVFHDAGPGRIMMLSRQSFAGFTADMDYRLDLAGAIGPGRVGRNLAGNVVAFDFRAAPIPAGASSRYIFIITNAWWYNPAGSTTIQALWGTAYYSVTLASTQPAL